MASAGLSKSAILKGVESNDESMTLVDVGHLELGTTDFLNLAKAFEENTVVTELKIVNMGMRDPGAEGFAKIIETNTTITKLDLGYNKIGPPGMKLIGAALKDNSTIVECKLHRQEKDMGTAVENVFAEIWTTNTTLQRLYITLHDRRCNQANTKGEVRNKSIAACIKAGKNWDHLDPAKAEEMKAKREAENEEKKKEAALAKAPISSKIESTGGPYTLKQLQCDPKYRPDDVPAGERHLFLADELFKEIFGMSKDEFKALPKWKQLSRKKDKNLH